MNASPSPMRVHVGSQNVGVWNYGDPGGRPVFAFHGTPACGAGFDWAHTAAMSRGLRLIAPDRPGVGISSPRAGWVVADYPAMVDALADSLGVDRYAVLGYSGGGPYAVSTGLLSDRVTASAVCAGMGQIADGWAAVGDFEKTDAQMLRMSVRRPALARAAMSFASKAARVSPRSAVKSFAKQLSLSDRIALEALGSPRETMRLFTEAFTNGSRGVVADYAALARPWGFDVVPTRVPFSLWHGDDDPMVPLEHANVLAARLGVELTVWPGEGHLGTLTHIGEILDWIVGVHT